jgi:hypothetical protein
VCVGGFIAVLVIMAMSNTLAANTNHNTLPSGL